MKITYENCLFDLDASVFRELYFLFLERILRIFGKKESLSPSVSQFVFRNSLKQKIWNLARKPYLLDPYLKFSYDLLSSFPSCVIVDVGANIGVTSLPLAKKCPSASIFAIEPHPQALCKLLQNRTLNRLDNIKVISAAIGSKNLISSMFTHDHNDGGHYLCGSNFQDLEKIEVTVIPLKEIFVKFNIDHCDLLKIDAEGFDYDVIQSLQEFGSPKKVSNIIVEYNPWGISRLGKTAWDFICLGKEMGYRCKILQTGKSLSTKDHAERLPVDEVVDLVFY